MHETLDRRPAYRSSRSMPMAMPPPVIDVQFRYRCPCCNYNYYHSIKRAGRFLGVAYIIILLYVDSIAIIQLSFVLLIKLNVRSIVW